MRADSELFKRRMARSRSAAAELIRRGEVKVNGKLVQKSSEEISSDDLLEVGEQLPFVSRAGEKLDYALRHFRIDVRNKTILDVGSSTGGFTDCLLRHGAKKVYALDVGHSQFNTVLANDPRIVLMEKTDIRKANLPEIVECAVIDVSFISLEKVLPSIQSKITQNGFIIALIKPQFEVGATKLNKKGVVTNAKERELAAERVLAFAGSQGFTLKGFTQSPIQGGDGNIEYLAYFKLE